jgi:hypothetical protein
LTGIAQTAMMTRLPPVNATEEHGEILASSLTFWMALVRECV